MHPKPEGWDHQVEPVPGRVGVNLIGKDTYAFHLVEADSDSMPRRYAVTIELHSAMFTRMPQLAPTSGLEGICSLDYQRRLTRQS